MSDFQRLAMVGLIELPDGIDKLGGKITWNSLYIEAARKLVTPFKNVQLQRRSNVQVFNNGGLMNELRLLTSMTITGKEYQLSTHKPRKPTRYEAPFSASYVQQMINGEEGMLLDYLAIIFSGGGKGQLARYNKSLGIS